MDKPAQWALVGAAWFLAASVAVFGFLCWQRLGAARPAPAVPLPAPAPSSSAAAPKTAVCPVTGETVTVGPDTPRVVYRGRTYYFSTDRDAAGNDARTRFLMDPGAWLKGPGGSAP